MSADRESLFPPERSKMDRLNDVADQVRTWPPYLRVTSSAHKQTLHRCPGCGRLTMDCNCVRRASS